MICRRSGVGSVVNNKDKVLVVKSNSILTMIGSGVDEGVTSLTARPTRFRAISDVSRVNITVLLSNFKNLFKSILL
ncbi:MAG: hypothetical protein H0U27_11230 [Nitrosopumilus sp.]|nr:hypothetical protein [Nitrosopumilus sp.]